ncbi:MAG TPA: hypothetical protein VIM64_11520 [Puia sp.]
MVNSKSCGIKSMNQGIGRCIQEFGMPTGLIYAPGDGKITEAQLATLKATLEANSLIDAPVSRWQPLGNLVNWEVANGDPRTETLPNNVTKYLGDGFPVYTARWDGGGFAMHLNRRKLTNSQASGKYFIIHNTSTIGGKVIKNTDGTTDLQGLTMAQVFTLGRGFATATTSEIYSTAFAFDNTRQLNEDYGFIEADFDVLESMIAVTDVELIATNSTSTKWNVKALAGYAKADLSVYFPTELAAAGAWVARNETAGTTLTISAVAAKEGYFELTLSAAPTSGNKLSFKLAALSVLEPLGVVGYESEKVYVTQP